MTFQQIVDMVLAGSFDETKREHAKAWVNSRYGMLLDLETWSFMRSTDTVTVTAGSRVVTGLPDDFGIGMALLDDNGDPLIAVGDPSEFLVTYPSDTDQSTPEAWTQIGASVMVGPASDETNTSWTIVYERAHVDMTNDQSVPIVPTQYHLTIVHGAKAEGMRMLGIPLWQEHEEAWMAGIEAMRRKYLATVRAAGARVWS